MSQPVTRIYESRAHAAAATADLAAAGFAADSYYTVDHPGGEKPEAEAAIAAALMAHLVPRGQAAAFAAEVVQGGALVAISPPFGFAFTAEEILDSHAPIGPSAAAAAGEDKMREYDPSAPLSSMLGGWATKYDDATPFSRFWSIPVLIDPATVTTALMGWPMLAKKAVVFDQWKTLIADSAPLSTAMGWGVKAKSVYYTDVFPLLTSMRDFMAPPKLIDGAKSFFSMFPALTDKPYVFASSAKLSDKASPLSEALSWPLLASSRQVFAGIPEILQSQISIPTLLESGKKMTSMFPLLSAKQVVLDMWPTLTAKVAPLSQALSWPMLTEKIAPLSQALSIPLLSAKQVVIDAFPTLSKPNASLSGALHVPMLTKEQ